MNSDERRLRTEYYTDAAGNRIRVPRGVVELIEELEWAVEADSAPDRNDRSARRRALARDALARFLAGVEMPAENPPFLVD